MALRWGIRVQVGAAGLLAVRRLLEAEGLVVGSGPLPETRHGSVTTWLQVSSRAGDGAGARAAIDRAEAAYRAWSREMTDLPGVTAEDYALTSFHVGPPFGD